MRRVGWILAIGVLCTAPPLWAEAQDTQMLPGLLGESTTRTQPDLTVPLERIVCTNTPDGVAAAIRAMRNRPDRSDLLPTIACPTIVVCGAEDVVIPPAECGALAAVLEGLSA